MRVLSVFGTRPEAIKMAPVINELLSRDCIESRVCVTAQHREMLDPFLALFEISPDWDLDLMKPGQTLFDITTEALSRLREVIESEHPDIVLVQGDTTTAFAASLAAFYLRAPVGHVEAGLRTGMKYSPFPEEMNRRLADVLTDLYFAPTQHAKDNLLREGVSESAIAVTGNTVVDALLTTLNKTTPYSDPFLDAIPCEHRVILVTGHRRESFGEGLRNICQALVEIAESEPDVEIIYPVHRNPNVQIPVRELLESRERIHLLEPLDYVPFVHLMKRAYLILTDSGGIQEEAPSLSKPVLVMRETTERPELIEAGAGKLVGTEVRTIVAETHRLLRDSSSYARMAAASSPFGDGMAAKRIVDRIVKLQAGTS